MINELATKLIDDNFDDEDKIVLVLSWLVHLYNTVPSLSRGTKDLVCTLAEALQFYLDDPFSVSVSDDGKLEVK